MSQGQTLPPGVLTITGDIPKATGHWIELSRYVALETDVRELRAANARLTAAASGRGMVSEMDGLPEIAVLVMGLYARAERAEAALEQARALLNKGQWQGGYYFADEDTGEEKEFVCVVVPEKFLEITHADNSARWFMRYVIRLSKDEYDAALLALASGGAA